MELRDLPKLNLSPINPRLRDTENGLLIYDFIRKRWLNLTPEEWVRQHLIHQLIQLEYPPGLIQIEKGFKYEKRSKRSDLIVFNTNMEPCVLIECKSPKVRISNIAVDQLSTYNKVIQSQVIGISNGLQHYFWKRSPESETYVSMDSFPNYNELIKF